MMMKCLWIFTIQAVLILGIDNDDSGWHNNVEPTTSEIEAYFKSFIGSNSENQYELNYKLNTPTVENALYYGEQPTINQGSNYFKVHTGIVREEVKPVRHISIPFWSVNTIGLTGSYADSNFSSPTENIFRVEKVVTDSSGNDTIMNDTFNWTFPTHGAYGAVRCEISDELYDQNAKYYVIYEKHDSVNANEFVAEISYTENTSSTIENLIQVTSDNNDQINELKSQNRILMDFMEKSLNGNTGGGKYWVSVRREWQSK